MKALLNLNNKRMLKFAQKKSPGDLFMKETVANIEASRLLIEKLESGEIDPKKFTSNASFDEVIRTIFKIERQQDNVNLFQIVESFEYSFLMFVTTPYMEIIKKNNPFKHKNETYHAFKS